ncbi:hypothetical protein CSHISOI_09818 [Colletotrichum shisoi]|uniref:Uncharacterized protein n=1 Tax=Colletotrichum shisoi TaxID=2078593 RepID=A0A5Q4BG03_9PEZI|nr:hypothetical protein CSHISOI_09818 [Colletotrichum shisoi]
MGLDAGKSYESSIALRHPHLVETDWALLARQAKGKDEMSDLLSQRETPSIREGGRARSRESDQRGERVASLSFPLPQQQWMFIRPVSFITSMIRRCPRRIHLQNTRRTNQPSLGASGEGGNGLFSNSAEGYLFSMDAAVATPSPAKRRRNG